MTDYNNLTGLRHSEQILVERTVRELEMWKGESGRLGVLEARKLSNPILRPIGRSVG